MLQFVFFEYNEPANYYSIIYFLIFNTMRKLLALSALFALLGLTSCNFGGEAEPEVVQPENQEEEKNLPDVDNGGGDDDGSSENNDGEEPDSNM